MEYSNYTREGGGVWEDNDSVTNVNIVGEGRGRGPEGEGSQM